MSLLLWDHWSKEWELQEKVSFNGYTKQIHVNAGVTSLDIMADVYSAWVRWTATETRFLPAIRYTGFDVIPGGRSGATFFLYNGWKLIINLRETKVLGVLFSDNYPTAYYDNETYAPLYPAEVSSVVNTVYSGGGAAPSVSEIWNFNTRSLTTPFPTIPTPPTVTQIRQEIDSNSTQLQTIIAQHDVIMDAVGNISVASSAIHAPATEFTLVSGTVTSGTFESTRSINGSEHIISDSAGSFDISYTFDIGLDSIPSEIVIVGRVLDKHENMSVDAWNYSTNQYEHLGIIAGSLTNTINTFVLYQSFVGRTAGQIGDVKIRFYSTAISDIFLHVDQIYVSYAAIERATGYSAHAVAASSTSITLGNDASTVNNYYTPCLVYVNHGTGEKQYAKAISYIGATRTLNLELPMVVTLDTTSHITLSAWAQMTTDNVAIADSVWSKSVSSLTDKTTIGGYISKVLLTIPKFLGLK